MRPWQRTLPAVVAEAGGAWLRRERRCRGSTEPVLRRQSRSEASRGRRSGIGVPLLRQRLQRKPRCARNDRGLAAAGRHEDRKPRHERQRHRRHDPAQPARPVRRQPTASRAARIIGAIAARIFIVAGATRQGRGGADANASATRRPPLLGAVKQIRRPRVAMARPREDRRRFRRARDGLTAGQSPRAAARRRRPEAGPASSAASAARTADRSQLAVCKARGVERAARVQRQGKALRAGSRSGHPWIASGSTSGSGTHASSKRAPAPPGWSQAATSGLTAGGW